MGGGGPAVGEGELGAPHEAVVEHRGRVQRHGRRLGVHESAADVNAPTQEATQVTRHRLVHVEILDGRPLMAAASLGIRASARADSLRHAVAARGELLSKSKVTIRVESHYPSRKSLSESKVTFRVESHYPSHPGRGRQIRRPHTEQSRWTRCKAQKKLKAVALSKSLFYPSRYSIRVAALSELLLYPSRCFVRVAALSESPLFETERKEEGSEGGKEGE